MHPKIPSKRVISSVESSLLQSMKTRFYYQDDPELNQAIILKYYPKYCNSLQLDTRTKSWPVISRIRQIKTTKNFKYDHVDVKERKDIIKFIKRLLCTKRRSIKSLPSVTHHSGEGNFSFMEMCPFFPEIKTLNVYLYRSDYPEEQEEDDKVLTKTARKEVLRSYGYFWETLRNLQRLKIGLYSPSLLWILQKIQSSKRFLPSLKNLTLTIMSYSQNTEKIFQDLLLEYQDLLKYVTQIDFHNSKDFPRGDNQVKLILNSCPKLHSLTFPLQEGSSHASQKQFLTLAPFTSLQNLTLNVDDAWGFIEAFELPLFINKLSLCLGSSLSWKKIWFHLYYEASKYEPKGPLKIKDQEKHKKFLRFFENFKQLTCLKSLALHLPQFTDLNDIMSYFILPMLRSMPKLEEFECQFYRDNLEKNNPLDLSIFFEGVAGSLEQLKSFRIFQHRNEDESSIRQWDVVTTFNPQKSYCFPNIISMNIDTWISEDFEFKSFFTMLAPISTNSQKEIDLPRIYMTSIESLLKLFKSLKEAEQLQLLKIRIGITLCLKDAGKIFEHLENVVISSKNTFVFLKICLPFRSRFTFQAQERMMAKKYFGNLKFNICYLTQANSGYLF